MLKPRNKAINVITAILAALMSILLVVLLFATAVVGTVNSITTPQGLSDTIHSVMQNIDFEQIVVNSAGDMDIPEEELKEAQIVDRLLETDAAEDIIDLVSAEIVANLNRDEGNLLNDHSLKEIVHEHADEITDILYEIDPSVDREIVRSEMLTYVDDNAAELVDNLMGGITESVGSARDIAPILDILKLALAALVVLCLLLAIGIYGCRWYRFGGFLWLGIDIAVAGLLTLVPALLIKNAAFLSLFTAEITPDVIGIITPILSAASHLFTHISIVLLVTGVLFIGLFILLKCTVINPKVKAAKAAELPAPEA